MIDTAGRRGRTESRLKHESHAIAPTPSVALHVSVLREELDGVTARIDDIDSRVSALEGHTSGEESPAPGAGDRDTTKSGLTEVANGERQSASPGDDSASAEAGIDWPEQPAEGATTSSPSDDVNRDVIRTRTILLVPMSDEQFTNLMGLQSTAEVEPVQVLSKHEVEGVWRQSPRRESRARRRS